MSIFSYLFIGVTFSFIIELMIDKLEAHPKLQNTKWGWAERLLCITIWPIAMIIFFTQLIREFFK